MIAEPNIVAQEILTFGNGDQEGFDNWPNSIAQAAELWANVVEICAGDVIPTSSNKPIAKTLFINTFNTMSIQAQNGYEVFSQALMDYATSLALGMTASGFTGTPPPIPFEFNMQGLISGSSAAEALRLSTDLVNWFKTGTATNISTGATINWS